MLSRKKYRALYETPTLIGPTMNKEKLNSIKNKIKSRTPEIIVAASAITVVTYVVIVAKTFTSSVKYLADEDSVLPVVTGEERAKLLAREDTIIQSIEPDLYFLSIVQFEDEK